MKKIVLILMVLITFGSIVYAQNYSQGPKAFVKKNMYGIILDNKVLVKPKYEFIEYLDHGLFTAKQMKAQYGIISTTGQMVVPFIYDNIEPFSNNIYLVERNKKWGLINAFNGIILPIEYTGFEFINDFLCEIEYQGKIGLINKYGGVIVLPEYDNIDVFNTSTFLVKKGSKSGIMDGFGRMLVAAEYDSFEKIADTDSYNVKKGNKIGIMSSDWKFIIPVEYDSITNSSVGKNLMQNGKIGFYTSNGKLIQPSFSQIVFYQPEFGLAVVKLGDKRGFVTSDGTVVLPIYENISRFSDKGIAFVERDGKLMAVNVLGKEMTVQETMPNMPPSPPM